MLSIGEMSSLCRISIKTLRHYDKIGLVTPSFVNEENGYRYYHMDQSEDISFITKMKLYNFTLQEISKLLILDSPSLYSVLMKKKKQLENDLVFSRYKLNEINSSIEQLERGLSIMKNDFKVTVLDKKDMNIASITMNMGIHDFEMSFEKLFGLVGKNNYTVTGPSMGIYHSEDFDPEMTEIETATPIKETSGEGTRLMKIGLCCMTTFVGPYIDFSSAYTALQIWIKENNYQIAGAPFEIYIKGVESELPPEQYITDIYFPIKKQN